MCPDERSFNFSIQKERLKRIKKVKLVATPILDHRPLNGVHHDHVLVVGVVPVDLDRVGGGILLPNTVRVLPYEA